MTPPLTADPRPISDSLDRHLRDAVTAVPAGQRGALTTDVSLAGWQAQLTHRLSRTWTVSAWGSATWSGQKDAGARLSATW